MEFNNIILPVWLGQQMRYNFKVTHCHKLLIHKYKLKKKFDNQDLINKEKKGTKSTMIIQHN